MTDPGQTDNYSVSDHLKAIIEHCGTGVIDYCMYDTGEVVPEFIKKYNMEGQELVEQDVEKIKGIKFLQRNLSTITNGHIRHDPNLVASSIIELICEDLKYQDKQSDPQYLMLNTKLREEKRITKIKKAMAKDKGKSKKPKKKMPESKSKFSSKYSERINSIRSADEKAKIKFNQREQANAKLRETKMAKEQVTISDDETQQESITNRLMQQIKFAKEPEKQMRDMLQKKQTVSRKTTSKSTEEEKNTKPKSARGLKRGTKSN